MAVDVKIGCKAERIPPNPAACDRQSNIAVNGAAVVGHAWSRERRSISCDQLSTAECDTSKSQLPVLHELQQQAATLELVPIAYRSILSPCRQRRQTALALCRTPHHPDTCNTARGKDLRASFLLLGCWMNLSAKSQKKSSRT